MMMKGMIEGNVYVTPRTHFFVYPPPTTHEHEDLDRRDETRRQLLMVMLDVGGFVGINAIFFFLIYSLVMARRVRCFRLRRSFVSSLPFSNT
jgi:hypothetical protein